MKNDIHSDIPDCTGRNMTMMLRGFSVDAHNILRSRTAKGLIPTVEHKPLPKAANMYKMDYSCSLELAADSLVNKCLRYQKSPTFDDNGWNFRDIDANTVNTPLEALREVSNHVF
ncbi:SCP-like protein [Dictyocaulus viviparus]|uniref:SCP-like protein n=1 Tax=Dictyocaulus viviparus TaxID=29172 RepID=A0A0D8X8V0_DICVI|nr:SCP-like protein [Dictyocaulus viviparus]